MTALPSLAGLRVLDLSRLLPGPYCTQLLTHMGAEVVKVETPVLGDYLRASPPEFGLQAMFEPLNRGKKSVALNYRNPAGQALLLRLVEGFDVVIESFRPGTLDRFGLGYAALSARNPRLIFCALSGYGQTGPYHKRGGHDLNYLAVAGLLALNSGAGEPVAQPGLQIADLAGGMLAAIAILGALVERAHTGAGRYLDVALLDGALSWALPLAAGAGARQPPVDHRGPLGGDLPCYRVYVTADDQPVTLAALEPHFWANFCAAVERPDLIPRQFDPAASAEVAAVFGGRRHAEWLAVFQQVDACVEPLTAPADLRQHPQVRLREAALVPAELAPAPALGQHTAEILHGLGLTAAELTDLAARGIIRLAA
ncbi:MAG: CoA transferase [Anaerolineales bacterium]|nr:CoA transferase [Anaerolineales bacterium]